MENDYWCRDCEVKFRSISNHAEFQQAACPSCHETCLSFEFELSEAERIIDSDSAAAGGLSVLFWALFGWFGLLMKPQASTTTRPKIFDCMDGTVSRPSVFSTLDLDEARTASRLLGDEGVVSEVEGTDEDLDSRFLVTVEAKDRSRGRRILIDNKLIPAE